MQFHLTATAIEVAPHAMRSVALSACPTVMLGTTSGNSQDQNITALLIQTRASIVSS